MTKKWLDNDDTGQGDINNQQHISGGMVDTGAGATNPEVLREFESYLINKTEPKAFFKTNQDRWGLPGWTYHNKDLTELEIKKVFRTHWQIVCHVSNIPKPGDFITDELLGDRVLVVRGNDNEVRVFYNVCRHRGSNLVERDHGNCGRILTCPFHGWTYHLDGSLMGVAQTGAYDQIDKKKFGLKQVEMEIWKGFIFIRFEKGPQPSLAEIFAPYEKLFEVYQLDSVVPVPSASGKGDMLGNETLNANWKSARDVDNEGYHVAKVHTFLRDLYGNQYSEDEYNQQTGVSLARGIFLKDEERQPQYWSVRAYKNAVKRAKAIPEKTKGVWFYVGLFPSNVIQLYPEGVSFYQDIPVRADFCKQRYGYYKASNVDAESKKYVDLAAKVGRRIDKVTYEEDRMLSIWSYEGQKSVSFPGAYLSNFESNVKAHQLIMQRHLPVMTMVKEPKNQDIEELNNQLLARLQNR
ncbi:MAG: aromatic ring-hydroxylating dioxygenase subunit alpha [Hydrotalea sp.]|nr:aromatic ring-hydroxylating dioxygenase subunit alpha [Hydrotalea sp.]